MPFHVPKPSTATSDAIGSMIALTLMIATWCVVYVIVCPPDPAPRLHVAEARR